VRELAILNLNMGICLINEEMFNNSLSYIDKAISLDPTYYKVF
jgi:hypothetical protein